MATRAQKVRLAVFFIVASSILAAVVLFIAGAHVLEKQDAYIIEFAGVPVGGLNVGAQVKYQGIAVGRVDKAYISPDDVNTVMVGIAVDPAKLRGALRRDTRAMIYNLGITGLKYIELIPGTNESEALPPGATITASETFMADLDRQAEVLTSKMEVLLDRVALLLDAQNRANFAGTLESGHALAALTADIVARNQAHMDTTFANLSLASGALASASRTMETTMDSLARLLRSEQTRRTARDIQESARHIHEVVAGPLPALIASMTELAANADKTVVHVDQTVLQSRSSLLNATRDMEETLQNLREVSELVRDNPAILIRGGSRRDDE
jgi:phospholipid/cholesterol/gamma-HCH transport system substrate-binding protein